MSILLRENRDEDQRKSMIGNLPQNSGRVQLEQIMVHYDNANRK